MKRDYKYFF